MQFLQSSPPMQTYPYYILVIRWMSGPSSQRCPLCSRPPTNPLNLKCTHRPCYQCALQLIKPIPSALQLKHSLHCPLCRKKTVMYDPKHLIMTQQTSEEMYVTDRFVGAASPIPQVTHNNDSLPKHSRQPSAQRILAKASLEKVDSGQLSRRGSIQSIANTRIASITVRCSKHKQPYKYFCNSCAEADPASSNCILCPQCARSHYSQQHQLLSLKHSEPKIQAINQENKQKMKLANTSLSPPLPKKSIEQHYSTLLQQLQQEHNSIISLINDNYSQIAKSVQKEYKEVMQVHQKMTKDYEITSKEVETLKEEELNDIDSQIRFYHSYRQHKQRINCKQTAKDTIRLPVIKKTTDLAESIKNWISLTYQQPPTHKPLTPPSQTTIPATPTPLRPSHTINTINFTKDKPTRTNSVLEEYKQSLQLNSPHSHRYQEAGRNSSQHQRRASHDYNHGQFAVTKLVG